MIQKLFTSYAPKLAASRQPLKNIKAIQSISQCRTAGMGASYYACEDQHSFIEQFHSCRHRSCYLCAQQKRLEWIEKQKSRLLNRPHFHVVFTMPHEYLSIWRYNEAVMTGLIFKASKETLMELLENERYQGISPGILMGLHTWGRQLNLHPHTHCLVTAGGLDFKGEWKDSGDYLLPVRVVKRVYRGKFQAYLKAAFDSGELKLPPDLERGKFIFTHRQLYKKEWSVRIEERYEHGKGVMLYLARYLKGGPLNPSQIKYDDEGNIGLRYLDHRDKRIKSLKIKPEQLISRLLDHVPAIGCHTMRYYGVYAPSSKKRYEVCLKKWGNLEEVEAGSSLKETSLVLYCKACGKKAPLIYRAWPKRKKGNSFIRSSSGCSGSVQQNDDTDVARVPVARTPDT